MHGVRLFAAVFAALVICGAGIAGAQDAPVSVDPSSAALSAAPEDDPGAELESKRTATSDTFRLPSGALETRISPNPINYRDGDGNWKPIDEGLQYSSDGSLTNGENRFDLHLPERMGAGPVRLSEGDRWVSYRLLGLQTETAELEDGKASYESSAPGVGFDLSSVVDGVKEQIELSDPSQPTGFDFELDASEGLTPSMESDGSLQFRDGDNHVFAVLPAPVIADSAHETPAPSGAVGYSLQEKPDGHWRLALEVDRAWLSQPDRSWPVRIDPTVTVPEPSLDCTFGSLPAPEGWNGCGASGQTELLAAYSQKENQPARSLVRFNMGAVPSNAYVAAATASLYAPAAAENTSAIQMRPATKTWTAQLNWTHYASSGPGNPATWSTPGGDYTSEGAEILTSQRGNQAGWWNFSSTALTEVIQRWVSGETPNQGLLIKNSNESRAECEANPQKCNRRYVAFQSSALPGANKPALAVTYYLPVPGGSKIISPSEGAVTARRLKLKAGSIVPGTTGVTFQSRVTNPKPGEYQTKFATIPSSQVKNAKGEAVTWPIAVQGAQTEPLYFDAAHSDPTVQENGGTVEVRALFEGPAGVAGYSLPIKATVSRFLGATHDATASVGPATVDLLTGNMTLSRTDVSVPGFGSALEFARAHNSRKAASPGSTGVLGAGWQPSAPVEAAGGAEWQKVGEVHASAEEEAEGLGSYAILTGLEGYEYIFGVSGGTYAAPPELAGWLLARQDATHLALTDPGGNRTVFEKEAGGSDYLPVSVSQAGGTGNTTQMVYEIVGGKLRLKELIAPAPEGIGCTESSAMTTVGCRALTFSYQPATAWGAPSAYGDRLSAITYYGASGESSMSSWEVAKYSYNSEGRLTQEWDPRISSPLKETYTYKAGGQLATLTPPGEEPWSFDYSEGYDGEAANGRLIDVKRPSLLSNPAIAQTTIVYGVPLSGSGAPYDMSAATVAGWGQGDVPLDATAIFPPDQVPGNPPSSYSRATVYYMDGEDRLVNTATPSGAGTSAASISTAEPDEYGNVLRELSAQNRLRSLAAGASSVTKSHELEIRRTYSVDGTEMQEEWGPLHEVRLVSGSVVRARMHKTVKYDQGAQAPPGGMPQYHLPTQETVGAAIPGQGTDADQRVTETKYNWTLREPTDTIVDPSGLNLRTHIEYDSASGLPTERRLPANPGGADAHTTKTIYYSAGANPSDSSCSNRPAWANLPCKVKPAAQPGPGGEAQPELLVTRIATYSPWGKPAEVVERPGDSAEQPGEKPSEKNA